MELFESPDLMPFDFCLWVWVESEVRNRKGGYSRRTTRDLRTGVTKCAEVDGGISERLL
jgi:hypothetical protein